MTAYFQLLGSLFFRTFFTPFKGQGFRASHVFEQTVRIGVQGLPMAALLALTIGIVLGMQAADQLGRMGVGEMVPDLVSASLIKELAPLVTAIIIIGRSGSAITAELGAMKANEEVLALDVMGIHPVSFLAVPRCIALVVMAPVITIFSYYVGMVGAYFVASGAIGMGMELFIERALGAYFLQDLLVCVLKGIVFGVLIGTIACHKGLTVRGGAVGIGRATTDSVVLSLLAVFVANAILTSIFFISA
ncbi:MAG: ABC transporter permease [Verrucomicrobiota bacterium]